MEKYALSTLGSYSAILSDTLKFSMQNQISELCKSSYILVSGHSSFSPLWTMQSDIWDFYTWAIVDNYYVARSYSNNQANNKLYTECNIVL